MLARTGTRPGDNGEKHRRKMTRSAVIGFTIAAVTFAYASYDRVSSLHRCLSCINITFDTLKKESV